MLWVVFTQEQSPGFKITILELRLLGIQQKTHDVIKKKTITMSC